MSIAGILRRWVLVSEVTGVLVLLLVPCVRAQSVSSSPAVSPADVGSIQPVQMPPNPNPNQPVQTPPSAGPLNPADFGDTSAPGMAPAAPVGYAPAAPAGYAPGRSVLDVIGASIFDDIYSPEALARWTPLSLGTFFSEGWDTPYAFPTSGGGGLAGTGGAPRHGWLEGIHGVFYRAWFFAFVYVNDLGPKSPPPHPPGNPHPGANNAFVGQYTIFVPLNRRFEFQFDYQFIFSDKGGKSNTYHGNTGDTTITSRFELSESKDFTQLFTLAARVPTGAQDNGNGVASISPHYEFWWNFYDKWAMRGYTGATVPTNHAKTSGYSTYENNLSIGRYFAGSKESWFQQWWFYLAANESSAIERNPHNYAFFSLQPGMRCKLTGRVFENIGTGLWYFFASCEVPMSYPHEFTYKSLFAVLYDY